MASATPTILQLFRVASKGDSGLSCFTDEEVGAFIDMMRAYVSDDLGDYGLALATAHELALSRRGGNGAAGAMISKQEGQLQRAYAAPQGIPGYWASTAYGLRLWGLIQRTIAPAWNRQVGYAEGVPSVMTGCDDENNNDGFFLGVGE